MDISPDSKALVAVALFLLDHKPPNISVREYVIALRSCTQSGNRPLDNYSVEEDSVDIEPRFLSGAEYWRQRFNEHETKLAELRVQIRELDEEKRLLQQQVDAADNEATGGVVGIKGNSKLNLQSVVENDEFVRKWVAYRAVYEPVAPASSPLLGQLRILHLTDEPTSTAEAFVNVCETLLLTIEELCTNPHSPLLCNTTTTAAVNSSDTSIGIATSTQFLPSITKDSTHLSKPDLRNETIFKAIDLVFRRLLTSLVNFESSTTAKEHRTTVRNAFIHLLVGTIDAIHLNSQMLLSSIGKDTASSSSSFRNLENRDLRSGLTSTLVSFISSLQYTSLLEREMLEAATYVILEAAGRCLCHRVGKEVSKLSKPATLKATSVFVLGLLKCVLAKYKSYTNHSSAAKAGCCGVTSLGHLALARFHEAIMFGVFGRKNGDIKVEQEGDGGDENNEQMASGSILSDVLGKGKKWGGIQARDDFILVDDSFADEVWALIGLEAFMLTW